MEMLNLPCYCEEYKKKIKKGIIEVQPGGLEK